jgi:ABC-type bacteriocin/lantibiotic exporter with double-glycine peptidase domain
VAEALASVDPRTIVIVVSHRQALLRKCRRVVVLTDGKLRYDGPPEGVDLERYLESDQDVAASIASDPTADG